MKTATKWLQRLKKTGIEKGTASITELKALIPEAASIRIDLSEDVRVLKQATCSYCMCNRPGEDLGLLVECKVCTEGYHGVCMGIGNEKAEALRQSKDGFKCIRCRINSLFTSAEQAMLAAMKKWMPSTCFAAQAGFEEAPSTDESGIYFSSMMPVTQGCRESRAIQGHSCIRRVVSISTDIYWLLGIRTCLRQVVTDGKLRRTLLLWLVSCETQ